MSLPLGVPAVIKLGREPHPERLLWESKLAIHNVRTPWKDSLRSFPFWMSKFDKRSYFLKKMGTLNAITFSNVAIADEWNV